MRRFTSLLVLLSMMLFLCLAASNSARANATVPQGGTSTFPLTGNDVVQGGYTWQIFEQGLLNAIATNQTPNGWSVATSNGNVTVTAPSMALVSTYEVKLPRPLGGGYTSANFNVVAFLSDSPLPGWAESVTPFDSYGADDSGPSASSAVNMATGIYENDPPDAVVHNPVGPTPIFERRYRSKNAYVGYSSPGLPLGWTHNYDVYVTGKSGSWGNLTLNYPNLATETWTMGSGSPPSSINAPSGAPYLVSGTASVTTGQWSSLVMTLKDQSQWTFTPSSGNANHYLLTQITGNASIPDKYITLVYGSTNQLTDIYLDPDDGGNPQTGSGKLLHLTYGNSGSTLSQLLEYSDPNNAREVDYTTVTSNGQTCLGTVSNLYQPGVDTPITRWTYTYNTLVNGVPFLDSVAVPKPDGTSGTDNSSIQYSTSTGTVQSLTDSNSNTSTYTYNSGTTSDQIQDPSHNSNYGMTWTQIFDSGAKNTGDQDANSNSESIAYGDTSNNPLEPTTFTNRNGQISYVYYDQSLTLKAGNVTEIDVPIYSSTGSPNLLTTKLQYDTSYFALGLLTQVTVSNSTSSKTPTNFVYYTSTGNGGIAGLVENVKTPQPGSPSGSGDQEITTYTYTSLGNVATINVPAPNTVPIGQQGSTVTYTYNYTDDPVGTHIQNEALGEPVTVTDPVGNVTHYRWNTRGTLSSVTDASGNQTLFYYYNDDQAKQVTFPDGSYIQYTYAYLDGPLLSATVYNSSGTPERTIGDTPGLEGETLQQTGDAEKGSANYDALYRFKHLLDGKQNTTSYQFDAVSNLKYLQFPNYNPNTSLYYDQMQATLYDKDYNLETFVDGLNRTTSFTWNNGSNEDDSINKIVFPSGTTRTFSYDGYGRVSQIQEGSGSAFNTYVYDYDDLDNVTEVDTTYLNYAGTGTLPTITVKYGFNNDGSRASMDLVKSSTDYHFGYNYFNNGLLQTVTLPWNNYFDTGSVSETLNYTYYPNDWLNTQDDSLVDTTYTYTPRGFLSSLVNDAAHPEGKSALLSEFTNGTYDASGNLVNMTWNVPEQTNLFTNSYAPALASNSTMTYGYQNEDYLKAEDSPRSSAYNAYYTGNNAFSYGADNADNLTGLAGLTLGFNADNQINSSTISGANYSYDGDGNPTTYYWQDPHGSGNRNLSVGYDDQDRMNSFGTYFAAGYRPDGLRAWKHTLPNGAILHFIYDGDQLLADFDDSGNLVDIYAWGAAGLAERCTSPNPNNEIYYAYSFDPSGNLVQRHYNQQVYNYAQLADYTAAYDAFGAQLGCFAANVDKEPGGQDSVGFGGQWGYYTDNETYSTGSPAQGVPVIRMPLVLCGMRYYDPQVGRFLNRDPMGYDGGIDLYAYCRNNPINYFDPLGMDDSFWKKAGHFLNVTGHYLEGVMEGVGNALCPNVYDTTTWIGPGLPPDIPLFHNIGHSSEEQAGYKFGYALGLAGSFYAPEGGGVEDVVKWIEEATDARNVIIIGEDMRDVIASAKAYNADYYRAKKLPIPWDQGGSELAMRRNRRWIRSKMKQGYAIIDIGVKRGRSVRSPFYMMEKGEIARRGYPVRIMPRIPAQGKP